MTKLMRDAEALYWKDKFENANSSGDFWRVVREMQGKAKPSVGAIRKENENIVINANLVLNVNLVSFAPELDFTFWTATNRQRMSLNGWSMGWMSKNL